MSNTVSPTEEGNSVKQESPEPFDKTICSVDASATSSEDLVHSLVVLTGELPTDTPYWCEQVNPDTRGLPAKTMRFTSKMEAALHSRVDVQDKARDAIWSKLSRMIPSDALPSGLPSVVFNERLLVDGTRRGVIDLVFPRVDAWEACTELKHLRVEGVYDEETHTFSYKTRTRTLPGSILAVQCIGLPIDDLDPRALFKAFSSMSSAVGTVLGLAKIVIDSEKWKIEEQFSGIVRYYIEIKPDNMAISWSRLIKKLPTHVRINGVPYALSYADRHLHHEDVFSTNYNVPPPGENDNKASIKRSRSTNEAADSNGSSSRSKKIKRSKEEEEEEE